MIRRWEKYTKGIKSLRYIFLYKSFDHGHQRDAYWFPEPVKARVQHLISQYYFGIAVFLYKWEKPE